jgi:integrase
MGKRQYSTYLRPRKAGRPIFYVRFRTAAGGWGPGHSTGATSENLARAWAEARIAEGTVPSAPGDVPTLTEWSRGFFGVGGRYDQAKRVRGRQLSAAYLTICAGSMRRHVLPTFGKRRLSDITALELEQFFIGLYQKRAGSTVNNVLKALRAVFAEAERLGVARSNPARRVGRFADNGRQRGALCQEELDALFALDALGRVWKGQRLPYLVAMVAAGCGLRHGEALALRPCDIRGAVLEVRRAWNRAAGCFTGPKWNSVREVPLPPRLQAELGAYITEAKLGAEDLLFAGPDPSRPAPHQAVMSALRDALEAVGVPRDLQARGQRFLDFHSLRHTFITRLRAGDVPDWQLEQAAGHRSAGMTRRYTHTRGEDMKAVAEAKILPFCEQRPA